MDIWLTTCRKTVPKCHHCKEPITLGSIMVVGKLWRTSKEGGDTRRWIIHFRWHAQKRLTTTRIIEENTIRAVTLVEGGEVICCWLQEGQEYLATHPQAETRGRKQLQLSKAQKSERLKILRQRARYVQKLKTLMEIPLEVQSQKDTDDLIKVGSQIEELKERILPLGGVPVSWG